MAIATRSQVSSERQKWDKIFNGLVEMLKSQREQVETLVKERKILEDRIKMQHERWVSDIHLYEDHLSQFKSDIMAQEMTRLLEATRSDMLLGLKHREASLLKLKLEDTNDDLADFRAWFDLLRQNLKESDSKSVGSAILEDQVRRLKLECDKLASEKRSEVSALLSEKDFVWNQYKLLESQLMTKLNGKHTEVYQANEKIVKLLASMEQLQSSNNEKDELIANLKNKVAEMEAGTNKWNDEISRLSRELELLRKSRSASVTPVLNGCTVGAKTSNVRGNTNGPNGTKSVVKKELFRKSRSASATRPPNLYTTGPVTQGAKDSIRDGTNVLVKKELPAAQILDYVNTEKGSRSSKRKVGDVSETPKLFTSNFKVPRLKTPSLQKDVLIVKLKFHN